MDEKEPMMTEQQRDDIKRLCKEAGVPDKSGELLTQQGAQDIIVDLREQIVERMKTAKG